MNNQPQRPRFDRRRIYARIGGTYTPSSPRFNFYKPAYTGDFIICDCWIVDKDGRKDPGFNVSPVPVHFSNLGEIAN